MRSEREAGKKPEQQTCVEKDVYWGREGLSGG